MPSNQNILDFDADFDESYDQLFQVKQVNRNSRRRQHQRLQPEGFNSATAFFADGATILDADVEQDKVAIFSCEIVREAANTGIVFEMGSATTGALVGLTATELVVRYGDGGAAPLTNGARFTYEVGRLPLNRKFKLSWSFLPGRGLFVWVNGTLIGQIMESGVVPVWADAGDGGYVSVSVPPTESGLTLAYDGTILSTLRYYQRRPDFIGLLTPVRIMVPTGTMTITGFAPTVSIV